MPVNVYNNIRTIGLFQQVIIQSGNFLGKWSIDSSPKDHAIEYAKYVNCTDTDTNKLIECLITVPTYQLIEANLKYMVRFTRISIA